MITIYMPSFPFRGQKAPYLWFFYKFLHHNREPINFILSDDYLTASPTENDAHPRWEFEEETVQFLGYSIPDAETLARHNYFHFNDGVFDALMAAYHRNPIRAFNGYLTDRIPLLETEFERMIANDSIKQSEAIITFANCPSLSAVAKKYSIPLIHIEIGPLRAPLYLRTAYFDFSGVNGGTEAEARYHASNEAFGDEKLALSGMRDYFLWIHEFASAPESTFVGVPLQVEDDSNVIAFSKGFDNLSTLAYATHQERDVLVRPHPNSGFALKRQHALIDESKNSKAFIERCRKIITINSSVGLEALLLGKEVELLGDSPFGFIAAADNEEEKLKRLGFFLFSYLVPFELSFNFDYIRFRLAAPGDHEIIRRHFAVHGDEIGPASTLSALINSGLRMREVNIMERKELAFRQELLSLQATLDSVKDENTRLLQEIENHDAVVRQKEQALAAEHKIAVDRINEALAEAQNVALSMQMSTSWKITKPLRVLMIQARRAANNKGRLLNRAKYICTTVFKSPSILLRAFKYFKEHGLEETLAHSSRAITHNQMAENAAIRFDRNGTTYIVTTSHCLYVAQLIQYQLGRAGIKSAIVYEEPEAGFDSSLHIVICPQMFKRLPGLYIAFQMEQSVSSRWFDDKYLRTLENSFAIFDYSATNMQFLQDKGLSHRQLYFMPIDYMPSNTSSSTVEKEYDVIFYGDVQNERRQSYLKKISSKFNTKVINNLFGEGLRRELAKAKVVINVHYYEGALLETTRIYECLSHDCLVVSESSSDIEQHPDIAKYVDFVPVGDIEAMLDRLEHWISDDKARTAKTLENREKLKNAHNPFEYYFHRFLLATDNIDFDQFYELAARNINFNSSFQCLGLPECTDRRRDFEKDNHFGFQYFPGLRHTVGWIGCGLSYKFIMRKAAEQGFNDITVCEDDVEFMPGWKEKFDLIHSHLKDQEVSWDIFSGLIANLHQDTKVKKIDDFEDFELIHIDKMISAVLNTYNSRVFPRFAKWDSNNRDAYSNTIDKYIEGQADVDVVTTAPFLVGHKEELTSTLWGFKNTEYKDIIAASVELLQQKVETFKES